MKKQKLLKQTMAALLAFIGVSLFAQDMVILDPAKLVPADTGYYLGGIYKDKDKDGVDEWYNGCVDEYGDASHNEAGVQQGWTYNKSMIMPTCYPKNCYPGGVIENLDPSIATCPHPEGYIELTKTKYYGTDSAILGYIISPPVTNVDSLYLETSQDNSGITVEIKFWIEYSKDNGTTWELSTIEDKSLNKTGTIHSYGDYYTEFKEMMDASRLAPIVIRIMSAPQKNASGLDVGQRLKVHYAVVYASKVSGINTPGISKISVKVLNNVISSEDNINVYNIMGQFVNSGKSVEVPDGIYIVKSSKGVTKVFVE